MPREPANPATPTTILDAAEELFANQGFGATSIKQIGERSGTNPALIYYYFEDKVGLYREVLARIGQTLAAAAAANRRPGRPIAQRSVESIVAAQAELLVRHPRAARLIVRELIDHGAAHAQPVIHRLASEVFRPAVVAIEAAQARGEIRADLDAPAAVVSTIAQLVYFVLAEPVVRALFERGADFPSPDDIRAFGSHAARFALGGLGLRPT